MKGYESPDLKRPPNAWHIKWKKTHNNASGIKIVKVSNVKTLGHIKKYWV